MKRKKRRQLTPTVSNIRTTLFRFHDQPKYAKAIGLLKNSSVPYKLNGSRFLQSKQSSCVEVLVEGHGPCMIALSLISYLADQILERKE